MAPARSLSPVTTAPPEPICTTASKRFAGAISMSLLVPLLEFHHIGKTDERRGPAKRNFTAPAVSFRSASGKAAHLYFRLQLFKMAFDGQASFLKFGYQKLFWRLHGKTVQQVELIHLK